MVSKPRLCDIFETALLAGWIEISGAWRSSFREPDVARTRRCEGCVVQDQATHASKDDGKSEGGSPPLARIRTTWRCLNRSHSGIGLRLLARVLLFSSAITLLLTLLQLYFDYRRDVGTIDRQISEIEDSYRRSLGEGLWNLDARQLELQVDGILHLPGIRFVEVREATDRADPMVVTAGSHQANADVHREFPIFHINRGAEQTLGVLSIEATLDDVYRRLFDTAIVILISQGAKTFVVSFFILYIVNRLITRHLVTAAKFLGGYDLRRSPPPLRLERRPLQQVDELDQLVGAFNGMCASLQTAYGALRDSEQRFRDYTEMASDWLWATDREHRLTFFSEHSGAFGYDWGKLIGKHRWEVAADFASGPEKWREHIAILERREPFRDFVYENRRTDGSPGIISVSGKPAFDAEGRFSGYRGVASDLTDRKRAEQALQRSESYLAEAQRLSHTGSWALNLKGERTIVYWSEESYRIYGLDPLQGLPTLDGEWRQVHPDDRSRLYEEIREAVRQKRDFVAEFRILLPDGTIKYLEAIAHHLFSAGGELLEVMGTQVDVTERKRAEEALRESQAKFRDYAESASDWFWEIGPDYKFTLLTENAFGSNAADRIGTACWDRALDLETEPEKWRLVRATLDSRKPFRDFVYCSMGGNGSPMYVKASGKPVFDANGEFRGYRGTGADVTAIMRAQEALRESERSLRSAIDGIAGLVAIMAPDGELETVNRQIIEYCGRSREELKNWGTNDTVHPEDLPRVLDARKRLKLEYDDVVQWKPVFRSQKHD